ncbi:MAG TPA: helix-turn-helix domain-containing protein [Burkholderiaceae bacterium]|nr:helix-turn-helix domain-containing protein [Burkholderiaceae bacterium]
MTSLAINPAAIAPAWSAFQRALPIKIGAIHNEAEYDSVVSFMNSLLDVVGDNEEHELADLLDLVAQLVEDYEGTHHTPPDAPPHEVLRFLMDHHGLKQTDLAAEIGGQSVVSDILNGKREINARQAKALAARFGVSAGVFL